MTAIPKSICKNQVKYQQYLTISLNRYLYTRYTLTFFFTQNYMKWPSQNAAALYSQYKFMYLVSLVITSFAEVIIKEKPRFGLSNPHS